MVAISGVGQAFTSTVNDGLAKVAFKLAKNGSPQGFLIARLYASKDSGGTKIPDDDPLNSKILASSDLYNMNQLQAGYIWTVFTFLNPYPLVNGVTYVVVLEVFQASLINDSNSVAIWGPAVGTCCTVNEVYYYNATGWSGTNSYDVSYALYYTSNPNTPVYVCPSSGCGGGYGHDDLNEVFPRRRGWRQTFEIHPYSQIFRSYPDYTRQFNIQTYGIHGFDQIFGV